MADADERRRLLRRRLAEFAKEHHPDRGGDAAFYIEGVRRLQAALAQAASARGQRAGPEVSFVTGRQRRRRTLARRIRRLRRRLGSHYLFRLFGLFELGRTSCR